jgi:hypothetical protein
MWPDNKFRELITIKVLHTSLLDITVVTFKVLHLGRYARMPAPSLWELDPVNREGVPAQLFVY